MTTYRELRTENARLKEELERVELRRVSIRDMLDKATAREIELEHRIELIQEAWENFDVVCRCYEGHTCDICLFADVVKMCTE